jgi:lysine-specific demethylase/histidyl-hydroxylase NO66
VEPEQFFASYWGNHPLLIKRNRPGYYDDLPGIGEVDSLITTTVFGMEERLGRLARMERGSQSSRPFRLTDDGRPDIHDIYRSYSDGYSIVLNRIEGRSPAVGGICRRLEAEMCHRVGANLYMTPAHAQGVRAHLDAHDVVITQIHGVKNWRVSTEMRTRNPSSLKEPIDIPDPQEWALHPGDALYIPRGYAHEGVTGASSSLHLTFGFYTSTWGDLLEEALRLVIADTPELQRALPVGHIYGSLDASDVAALVKTLAAVRVEDVLESARLSIGSMILARQRVSASHFPSLDSLDDLTIDSTVRRAFDGPCRIQTSGERTVVHYPGNYLSVPLVLQPALEHAATEHIFTIASLPGSLDENAKIKFVARLIREGFLAVVNPRREAKP